MVFETPRLLVRRFAMTDIEDFYHFNSDEEVMRYIRSPLNWDDAYHFLQQNIEIYREHPGFGRWAVFEKKKMQFLGSFMLRPSDSLKGEIEMGYALFKPFWGKGYATELVENGLLYAFSQMHIISVIAITHLENESSKKVLLKSGFLPLPDFDLNERMVCLFAIKNPVVVETERLFITPLNYRQLALYIEASDKLERKLNLAETGRLIAPQVKTMVTLATLPKMKRSPRDNYLFHTFWLIIEKKSKTIIAELGFKGAPGKDGGIEIGYGTLPEKRRMGFMTEAVGGMIQWAKGRPDLRYILAETDEQNKASIRVVEKNNFKSVDKIGKMRWWKVDLEN